MGSNTAVAPVSLDPDAEPRQYYRDVQAALALERERTAGLELALEEARRARGDASTRLRFLGSGSPKQIKEAKDAARDAADDLEENRAAIEFLETERVRAFRRLRLHEHDDTVAAVAEIGERVEGLAGEVSELAGELHDRLSALHDAHREASARTGGSKALGLLGRNVGRLLATQLAPFMDADRLPAGGARAQFREADYPGLVSRAYASWRTAADRRRAELENINPPADTAGPPNILEADPADLSDDDRRLRGKMIRERQHLANMKLRESVAVALAGRGVPRPLADAIARDLRAPDHEGIDIDTLEAAADAALERARESGRTGEGAAQAAAATGVPLRTIAHAVEVGREKREGAADAAADDGDE